MRSVDNRESEKLGRASYRKDSVVRAKHCRNERFSLAVIEGSTKRCTTQSR